MQHSRSPDLKLAEALEPLGRGSPGWRGEIVRVGTGEDELLELERRLLEMGFVEGAAFEILHAGPLGGDPLAIRIGGTRVAIRRREASAIMVRLEARR